MNNPEQVQAETTPQDTAGVVAPDNSQPSDAAIDAQVTAINVLSVPQTEAATQAAVLRQARLVADYLYQNIRTLLPDAAKDGWVKRCVKNVEPSPAQLRTSNHSIGILLVDDVPYRVFGSFGSLPIGKALSNVPKDALVKASSHSLAGLKLETLFPEIVAPNQRIGPVYWATADMNDDPLPKPEFVMSPVPTVI